jgi:hypothetical protein
MRDLTVTVRAWAKERLEHMEPGFGPLHDLLAYPKARQMHGG